MRMPRMTLYVRVRVKTGKDRYGNETYEYSEPIAVEGCMFAPSSSINLDDDRPEGTKVSAIAYFPRGWAQKLQKAQVSVDKETWFDVVGRPIAYPCEMLPKTFPYDCQVRLKAIDG